MTHLCINCNAPTVQRTGDTFRCEKCKYTWDVAHEQANARYLETQGRQPAQSLGETTQTLDAALGLGQPLTGESTQSLDVTLGLDQPSGETRLLEEPATPGVFEPLPEFDPAGDRDSAPVIQPAEERVYLEVVLESWTVDELEAIASEAGVDLSGARRKADKIAALVESGRVQWDDDQQTVIAVDQD